MTFQPDYRNFESVMRNRKPARLPLYEHIVSPAIMERILGTSFHHLENNDPHDLSEYFRNFCGFFRQMTYDTVSYEVCICSVLPGKIAICGGKGPIQSRSDFNSFPWRNLPGRFRELAHPRFDALCTAMPPGMKAVGGPGNGVFELAEALVGLEYLPYMEVDDPELYTDLFSAIGNMMSDIWQDFMPRYSDHFVACRFGDDLGFKSSLLTTPSTVRNHIIPQYKRIINIVHSHDRPFLWHSCGCIFEIMEDIIALGINAKHSNEDAIAPFTEWIARYAGRIALLGGFDMDFLCSGKPGDVYQSVLDQGRIFRDTASGYALGSGNSIPDFVPVENYLAMIRACQSIRNSETGA